MAEEWNKLDGVKALVESGISTLPDIYIKPSEQRRSSEGEEVELHDLDVIDLAEGITADIISKLVQASHRFGFFQLVNHGVDQDLMTQMLRVSHQFFQLPLDEKMKLYNEDVDAPVRYGTSHSPLKEKVLDWSDNLLHRFMAKDRGQPHPWPENPPSYAEIAERYVEHARSLGLRLLSALSLGLGLDKNYLDNVFGGQELALRLNYYPPCPQPELALGLGSHSDIGGLTILLQDDVPGLQVKLEDEWKTVKPIPGALVVNISDQLQILSNGFYRSVEHRAVLNSETTRVSVGVFVNPEAEVVVAPIPQLLDDEHPALYPHFKFQDYIINLFSKGLAGKELVEAQKFVE